MVLKRKTRALEELDTGRCLFPTVFKIYFEKLTEEALKKQVAL